MKKMAKTEQAVPQTENHVNFIYNYYCKLNHQKIKHHSFDDVNHKATVMDLHQFMTFCQDFKMTAKQQLRDQRGKKNLKAEEIQVKQEIAPAVTVIQNVDNRLEKVVSDVEVRATGAYEDELQEKDKFIEKTDAIVMDVLKTDEPQPPKKVNSAPKQYLNEKTLSEIFKKYASPGGEANFEQFQSIMQLVALKMYTPERKSIRNKQKSSQRTKEKKRSSKRSSKNQQNNFLEQLLEHLKLNSKESLFEIFKQVNQKHGNKDHLSMMRQPLKKIHVSDPLGRYAGLENGHHSRLVQASNKFDKMIHKNQPSLPVVASNKIYQTSLKHTQEQNIKNKNKENLQHFLNKNKNQIDQLNKNYESKSRIVFNPQLNSEMIRSEDDLIPKTYDNIYAQKKVKKYSQRHKDKIMGDLAHKEIGKLIDASELYSDEVFNKYLEVNHSPIKQNSANSFTRSRILQK